MQLYNAPNKNLGFTLTEVLVTAIVVGVISAIAAPNLIGLLNQNQVKDGLVNVEGALKEAQRQAKKLGKTCTVTFNNTTKQITAAPAGCLLSNRTLNDQVNISATGLGNPFNIAFSYKGTYGNALGTTIVVSGANSNQQRCLAISSGIGIMRTGNYDSGTSTCTTTE